MPASVPSQTQTLKDVDGKQVSDLISADTKIDKSGNVIGTLKYIENMPGFGEGENNGNYFPVLLDEKYEGQEITVKRDGVYRNKSTDLEWVLYVPSNDTKFTFETQAATIDTKGGTTTILTLGFQKATLVAPTGEKAVAIPDQERSFGRFGNTKDLIKEDVQITWAGTKGTVNGTVKFYTYQDTSIWGADHTSGHYLPFILDARLGHNGVKVTAANSKTGTDCDWILRIDEVMKGTKKILIETLDGTEVADLDLTSLTLEEPFGQYAIEPFGKKTNFGRYGKAEMFWDEAPSVTWDGINATMTGKLKYYTGGAELLKNKGNYLPVVLNKWFEDNNRNVAVYIHNERHDQGVTDWIITVKDTDTPLTVKDDEVEIAKINLSGLELEGAPVGEKAVNIAEQADTFDDIVGAVSELIDKGVKISWEGTKGTVTGKAHWHKFTNGHFKDKPEGHFVPIVISGHDGEMIKAVGSDEKTAELQDPKWAIRVDDYIDAGKTAKFYSGELLICELDFSGMTLELAKGRNAIALPDKDFTFTEGGKKASDYCDFEKDFKIEWTYTEGWVSGTFKADENQKYHIPIVVNKYLKDITIEGSEEDAVKDTTDQTVWLVNLGEEANVKKKKITVKSGSEVIANLNFVGFKKSDT